MAKEFEPVDVFLETTDGYLDGGEDDGVANILLLHPAGVFSKKHLCSYQEKRMQRKRNLLKTLVKNTYKK